MRLDTTKKLRILMLLPMPWSRNLGAPRGQMELADEFARMGHEVSKFDFDDAMPPLGTRFDHSIRWLLFPWRARAFVRANASKYDVIDTHQGCLPFPRQDLGFPGVLSVRSIGLIHLHKEGVRLARSYETKRPGTAVGRLLARLTEVAIDDLRRTEDSLRAADVVILNNKDELAFVREHVSGVSCPLYSLPTGISAARRAELARCNEQAAAASQKVVFLGMWVCSKGSVDLPIVADKLVRMTPGARFLLLGTHASEQAVRAAFGALADRVDVVPRFDEDDLPRLLAGCRAGVFPSYVEGFGIAVVEKLCAGIPTVAYEVPGPRSILSFAREELLVPLRDHDRMAERLAAILSMDDVRYRQLRERCYAATEKCDLERVAHATLRAYQAGMKPKT